MAAARRRDGSRHVRHYEILHSGIAKWNGVCEQGEGDSVVGAFARASDALGAALDVQRSLAAEAWPDGIRRGRATR